MNRVVRPNRRALLSGALVGTVAALAGCSSTEAQPSTTSAAPQTPPATPTTPKAALERLMEGNQRWVQGKPQAPHRDPARRQAVAQEQKPFAAVLSCIDSRVPPELIFDVGLGDLFVTRTGGEAVGPVVTGSVEYGPLANGTPLIVVLGHQRCGAIKAAYASLSDGETPPGNLAEIVAALQPAYEQVAEAGGDDPIDAMVRAQIELAANELRSNPELAPLVTKQDLAIVGAYYSLDTGAVEVLSGAPS
ncbi:carbonic anhydrase [Salinispora sp. H7-4]|nr:carbonic anhydrase [Salinispora sp. H7-4]